MKKLMLTLILAVFGFVASDVFARGKSRYEASCETSCEPCEQSCKVDKVIEDPCPALPCCVRYVRVEEPALVTKHVSYSVECPSGCTEEQKAAGMMKAGETWDY